MLFNSGIDCFLFLIVIKAYIAHFIFIPMVLLNRSYPLYVDNLGTSHGLNVVVESYFGLNDMVKMSDFKMYIHQSGSVPDMLNSTTIEVLSVLKQKYSSIFLN